MPQYADRVKENTTTTGTGPYTLAGAVVGFQSFAAVGDGNTCEYAVTDGTEWETGLGTYSAPGSPSEPTLERTTVYSSSNGNNAVNWGAGSKEIFLTLPASRVSLLGTVTSITVTGANGIGVSGSPITSSGTIGLSLGDITPTSVSTPSIITAAGALGITPAAGSNLNLNLSTTGDFAVNTNQFYVDTSAGFVGVGIAIPSAKFQINNATASSIGLIIKSTDDDLTNSAFEVQKSTGVVRTKITPNGDIYSYSRAVSNGVIAVGSASSTFHAPFFYSVSESPLSGFRIETSRASSQSALTAYANAAFYWNLDDAGITSGNLLELSQSAVKKFIVSVSGNTIAATAGLDITIGNNNKLQVQGTTAATNSLGISAWSADALGSRIELGKSRGATIGTNTIVQDGDVVGSLLGYGANGSTFTNLASISMEVDGTPGATTDMPGRIVFSTVPNGSGTLTEAMRLSQDQSALFANTIKTAAPTTGTAAPWKLGTLVTGQVGLVMLSTQYVEVDISGTLVKLATI